MTRRGFRDESFGEYSEYLKSLGADNRAEHRRLVENLKRALREELTARQFQTVTMYYMDDMSMCEIAAELGVCVSTVSRTIARGKNHLKRCLKYGARELLNGQSGAQ